MSQGLSISIRNFRAIKEADIHISAITTLAGYNASGKSTISRLLYYSGFYSNEYDKLLIEDLVFKLSGINIFLQRVSYLIEDKLRDTMPSHSSYFLNPTDQDRITRTIDLLKEYYEEGNQVRQLEKEYLGRALGKKIRTRAAFFSGLDSLQKTVNETFKNYERTLKDRPLLPLHREVCRQFKIQDDESIWDNISIKEDDAEIIGGKRKNVGLFTGLQRVFYIDTPMLLNVSSSRSPELLHWTELHNVFMSPDDNTRDLNENEEDLLQDLAKIAGGTIHLRSNTTGVYRGRQLLFDSGSAGSIPIAETASGIKSFAILQRLLQKGLLDDSTLLILDEPEAHLHPQWVAEYANIILRLNDKLGVRFLIASHSPTLVQALYSIADSQGRSEQTSFYLAEPVPGAPGHFRFNALQSDIEPIFELYNTSYDTIDKYAEDGGKKD